MLKAKTSFILLFVIICNILIAQNICKKVNIIKSKVEKKAMQEVIDEWTKQNLLKVDKGIIILTLYKEPFNAKKMWSVYPTMTTYGCNLDVQTIQYDVFNNYIILVYETDKNNRNYSVKHDSLKTKQFKECLNKLVGNKIYPDIPANVDEKIPDGSIKREERKVHRTGNWNMQYFIKFYKKDKYIIGLAA